MAYTLNDYYPLAVCASTRAEVYTNNDTAAQLLAFHQGCGMVELPLRECISATTLSLPMPSELMPALDNKIKAARQRVIVTGIDGYLALLDEQGIKAFMTALKSRLDTGKLNAAYLISRAHFDYKKFSNPKYANDLYIAYLGGENQYLSLPTVTVISDKWVAVGNNPTSWNALLQALGPFEPTGDYTLVLSGYDRSQAGLSDRITQAADIVGVAKRYYNTPENLPQNVLETIVVGCKEGNIQPLEWLKTKFGMTNTHVYLAVKRLCELRDDVLWSAYLWLLKSIVPIDSYLGKVLSASVTADNLLRRYVCDMAILLLADENAEDFANERAKGIKELNNEADALIIEFINKANTYPNETVANWLNCNTEAERIEIVRRVSESDLTVGLPSVWGRLYPLLSEYLSDNYEYGNTVITAYFRDYRRLRVGDTVTEAFVKRAFETVLPISFAVRDSVLGDLSTDSKTALLVVDGMGAEYYPLLCGMASRKSMHIESNLVAAVRLPSSTAYNPIAWDHDRLLKPEIHEVDNISHHGAVKYQHCTPAHNLVATLAVFETITNRVAEALAKYERVVVTADHGASRLAVVAHEAEMGTTLPWKGTPSDWRYAVAPDNVECPRAFEPYYDAENNITYWIVRGYNRLPKKGGKLSVHGGATLEERLVPVVVFSKAKATTTPKQISKQTTEQLIDKMGFDI